MNGLNQMIAQGVRPVQIESPLGQMAQFEQLRAAQQANVLRQRQQEEAQALNELYRQSFNVDTGRVDEGQLLGGLAQRGLGSKIPGMQEQFAKGREATAKAEKAGTESVLKRIEFFRSRLEGINDLDGYVNWGMASFNDPVLGPALRSAGSTPEKFMERVQQAAGDPNGLQRLLQESRVGVERFAELNKPTFVEAGGARVPVGGLTGQRLEGVPEIPMQPLPADVEAQRSRIAKAGATSVNVSTERAYGGEVAKLAAQQDIELANQASGMVRNATKIDEALDLLYNADINTGLGAEMFTVLDKARSKFAADKAAGRRVESTEYLDALLGSDVFPQISALGIGARGLDTPAEREFLRSVITGSIKMDRETLIRMTEFRRRAIEDSAKVYNERVESGALDKYFEYTGRPKAKIEVPKAPTRTQAPMYANNPQTGARIVSTDGGNTWRPVGQ